MAAKVCKSGWNYRLNLHSFPPLWQSILEDYCHERQHNLAQDSYLLIQLGTANSFSCYCQIQNNSWLLLQRWLKVTVCSGTRGMCKVSCESRHSPCSLECLGRLPGTVDSRTANSSLEVPQVFSRSFPLTPAATLEWSCAFAQSHHKHKCAHKVLSTTQFALSDLLQILLFKGHKINLYFPFKNMGKNFPITLVFISTKCVGVNTL